MKRKKMVQQSVEIFSSLHIYYTYNIKLLLYFAYTFGFEFCSSSQISRALPLAMVLHNKASFANDQFSGLDTRSERAKLSIICLKVVQNVKPEMSLTPPKLIFSTGLIQPNQYVSS